VWDLQDKQAVTLNRGLLLLILGPIPIQTTDTGRQFAFAGPDRLIISSLWWVRHNTVTARVVAVPSGQVLSKPKIPPGPLFRAADPGFVIVRPFGQYAAYDPKRAAAVELSTGQIIISNTPAIDIYGRYYIAEPSPGVVGLYERGKGLQATLALHPK
jgi:hypothetical protein